VKSVVLKIRSVDFVRYLELSLVENLINTRMATALFLAWIDPSGVGCSLSHQQSGGQETQGKTDSRRIAHFSAD
jgi:hypothetical protein